jgi:hypothetical protein
MVLRVARSRGWVCGWGKRAIRPIVSYTKKKGAQLLKANMQVSGETPRGNSHAMTFDRQVHQVELYHRATRNRKRSCCNAGHASGHMPADTPPCCSCDERGEEQCGQQQQLTAHIDCPPLPDDCQCTTAEPTTCSGRMRSTVRRMCIKYAYPRRRFGGWGSVRAGTTGTRRWTAAAGAGPAGAARGRQRGPPQTMAGMTALTHARTDSDVQHTREDWETLGAS